MALESSSHSWPAAGPDFLEGGGTDSAIVTRSMFWRVLLPQHKLRADQIHVFQRELVELGPISHVRFNVIPDGGVNRLRVFGTRA